ncbi:MAG TPA: hypothetical protein VFV50_11740, partial [Bdellovibrionales bacterium]|nr:hypothetical protein [Bdellovibrionales bacterium]
MRRFITVAAMVFVSAASAAPLDPIRELLVSHPGWQTKSVTSHDFWGGNGDGHYFGGKQIQYKGQDFKVLFHERGEGLIQRFLISARDEEIKRDYLSLVVLVDGKEAYAGNFFDFFSGKGPWKSPLVNDIKEAAGSYVSYVPFAFKSEAMILMRSNPHFYQVTYREGPGSSAALTAAETAEFMTTPWWAEGRTTYNALDIRPNRPAQLAAGPALVTRLKLRLWTSAQLQHLKIQVGAQPPVPLAFFFGLGVSGAELDHGVHKIPGVINSALFHVNPRGLIFASRLPIPLREGE